MVAGAALRSLAGGRDGDVAIVEGTRAIDYGELRDRIADRRAALGESRRLVMVTAANALDPLVSYLAALEAGHPVLLVADGGGAAAAHRAALVERFDPDVVVLGADDAWAIAERRTGSAHRLHPDLAMLSSTSGSTGSPKLVRLSLDNLRSNALAIAEYLRIDRRDRAATTLPMHYCYGLSVVNSHLITGGGLLLTERSVADERFWAEFAQAGATSFAGVPYTFELLDATGFADRDLPSLRYVTQAGGRMAPETVRRYARLGTRRGFELVVMYGQTEATARMAYLPPELAETRAGAIGRAIPGGSLRIDAAPGEAVGELVYSGPNVMLGYAEDPADLAAGREVHELRTGDLAIRAADGLFEIVGRSTRFVKVFGLRIDLDRVEGLLADTGVEARAAAVDERLLVFVRAERTVATARQRVAETLGIPARVVEGHAVTEFPRTASGKTDYAALVRFAESRRIPARAGVAAPGADRTERIRQLLAELLGRPDASVADSFSTLGGDSLSHVEVSVRLEALLGRLPRDWPTLSASELAASAEGQVPTPGPEADAPRPRSRPWLVAVDTSGVLRAVAIVAIVGTHADLFFLQGGAHLLLAVLGYNLARFQLADVPGTSRVRRLLTTIAKIAVPAVLWIGAVALLTGRYGPATVLLVNNFAASGDLWTEQWQYWFLEAALWGALLLVALFASRRLDLLERARPFAFALVVLGVALAARLAIVGIEAGPLERYTAAGVLWLVALGWLAARATTWRHRALVSALAVVATWGFLGQPVREAVVVVGILVLLWLPSIPLPRLVTRIVRLAAGASLFIYLTHWQVYPTWESTAPWAGTLLSFAVGIAVWMLYSEATTRAAAWWRDRRRALSAGSRLRTATDTGRPRPRQRRRPRDRARTSPPREPVPGG